MALNKRGYIDCSDDDFKIFALSALRSSLWEEKPNDAITVVKDTLLNLMPCLNYGTVSCMVNDMSDSPFLGGPQEGMEDFWEPLKKAAIGRHCLAYVDETSKNNFLKPESPEFGIMAVRAVDYAVGRRTYVPSMIVCYLLPLLDKLSSDTLADIKSIICSARSLGDKCDEVYWVKLLNEIENGLKS